MNLHGNIVGNPVPRPNWDQTDSGAADFIKNKPDIDAIERKANDALPKTGGDVLGNLAVGGLDDETRRNFYVRRLVGGEQKSFRAFWGDNGVFRLQVASGGDVYNYIDLNSETTDLKNSLSIASGGTGATNAADALNALGGLSKGGGTMTGAINMGSKKITSLATPTNSADAATKGYVDGKRIDGTCTLTVSGWTNGIQTVTSSRVYATDMPHWCVVYSSDANTRKAEKEAFALVDELETQDGAFVFRCFGDAPTVPLNIQWEVNR